MRFDGRPAFGLATAKTTVCPRQPPPAHIARLLIHAAIHRAGQRTVAGELTRVAILHPAITLVTPTRALSPFSTTRLGFSRCWPSTSEVGDRVIFFSVGLPGRFAEWCDAVIARLAQTLGGTVAINVWPSLDEMLSLGTQSTVLDQIAFTLIRDPPTHLIIGARQPEERLRNALVATKTRFVVTLDDPRVAVADILAEVDLEMALATRAVANSCSMLLRYIAAPGALTIDANRGRADASGTVLAIARHLDIPIDMAEATNIVGDLEAVGLSPNRSANDEIRQRVSDAGRKLVDGALAAYRDFFSGGSIGQIVWTRDLFGLVADPAKKLTEMVDVSGGVRCLIHGGYIHLSPGSWKARAVLGFSQEAVGYIFQFIGYAGDRLLASTSFQPEAAGIHAAEINFSLGEATGRGVDLRVLVLSENAKGQLAFGHVVLNPVALPRSDAAAQSQDDFEAVLDL
jgi:hypothetical protein